MTEAEPLIRAMLAAPHDDAPRLILADWYEERSREHLAAGLRLGLPVGGDGGYGYGGYGYGDGGGDGGYGDGGYGDGGGGYGGGGYGDGGGGYGGGGDGGDGYGGGGGGGGGDKNPREVIEMTDGLYILSVPSGYYPYVLVGWVEVEGLELVVRGARVIRRFGACGALAELARSGPVPDTELLAAGAEEYVWRPFVSRAIPCDPKAWKKACPRPRARRTEIPS